MVGIEEVEDVHHDLDLGRLSQGKHLVEANINELGDILGAVDAPRNHVDGFTDLIQSSECSPTVERRAGSPGELATG